MRSNEERIQLATRRAKQLEQQSRSRRVLFSCMAISLAMIFGLAGWMPSITANFSHTQYNGGMAAGIFSSGSLGYLLVGLIAFALGVCVTLFCMRLRRFEQDADDEEREDD